MPRKETRSMKLLKQILTGVAVIMALVALAGFLYIVGGY